MTLLVSPFLNIDGDNLLAYEYRMAFWLGLPIPNFGCANIGWWPSLLIGLLSLAVFATHFIAYAKCQPVVISRLVGGDGHERMVIYVPERGRWRDWHRVLAGRRIGRVQLQ